MIHSLPTQVLQDGHRLLGDSSNCGVCLQGFQVHQRIRTLPCHHPFHITCIDNWLSNHSQCPVYGSYVGSVITTASRPPNRQMVSGVAQFRSGPKGSHALGGAGKRPSQRLKGLNDSSNSAASLPSSFTLSGSQLMVVQNDKSR